MKLSLCLAVCVLFVASGAMAVEKGNIEVGGGLDLHLSPSPWVLDANMHLLYYMNPMLGVGPWWDLYKMGKPEGASDSPPTYYGIGAMGKIYLPMAWVGGKVTPFVEPALGLRAITKFDDATKTESKPVFMARVGFDYWLTDKWTVWVAYQADKLFADKDKYPEFKDFQSSIKIGIATFLMK